MRLENRAAARLLAEKLETCKGEYPLILALPRGAVPLGRALAGELGGDLDVALVRKLGAPGNPELSIGFVDETGKVLVSDTIWELGIPPDYVHRETLRQLVRLEDLRALYTPDRPAADPEGRVVIVVGNSDGDGDGDGDGVTTGSKLIAVLRLIRKHRPRRLVAALASALPRTVERARQVADEVVCLQAPRPYHAVGSFSEVTDADVAAALAEPSRLPAAEAMEELATV
jgi:putative phosphoribosyl transferase